MSSRGLLAAVAITAPLLLDSKGGQTAAALATVLRATADRCTGQLSLESHRGRGLATLHASCAVRSCAADWTDSSPGLMPGAQSDGTLAAALAAVSTLRACISASRAASTATCERPADCSDGYQVHPALLDAATHLGAAEDCARGRAPGVPVGADAWLVRASAQHLAHSSSGQEAVTCEAADDVPGAGAALSTAAAMASTDSRFANSQPLQQLRSFSLPNSQARLARLASRPIAGATAVKKPEATAQCYALEASAWRPDIGHGAHMDSSSAPMCSRDASWSALLSSSGFVGSLNNSTSVSAKYLESDATSLPALLQVLQTSGRSVRTFVSRTAPPFSAQCQPQPLRSAEACLAIHGVLRCLRKERLFAAGAEPTVIGEDLMTSWAGVASGAQTSGSCAVDSGSCKDDARTSKSVFAAVHFHDRLLQTAAVERSYALPLGTDTGLVTGGTSGVGLLVASWLLLERPRPLALLGTQGRTRGSALALTSHASLTLQSCDVGSASDRGGVHALTTQLPGPVGGVFHAAGTARDALLVRVASLESVRAVTAPKRGASVPGLAAGVPLR